MGLKGPSLTRADPARLLLLPPPAPRPVSIFSPFWFVTTAAPPRNEPPALELVPLPRRLGTSALLAAAPAVSP